MWCPRSIWRNSRKQSKKSSCHRHHIGSWFSDLSRGELSVEWSPARSYWGLLFSSHIWRLLISDSRFCLHFSRPFFFRWLAFWMDCLRIALTRLLSFRIFSWLHSHTLEAYSIRSICFHPFGNFCLMRIRSSIWLMDFVLRCMGLRILLYGFRFRYSQDFVSYFSRLSGTSSRKGREFAPSSLSKNTNRNGLVFFMFERVRRDAWVFRDTFWYRFSDYSHRQKRWMISASYHKNRSDSYSRGAGYGE